MFLVFKGTVSLDFGVDGSAALATVCGPGALVGLPATLSRGKYSMTATVGDDAELGFISPESLESLLRGNPELCQELLRILSETIAHSRRVTSALLQHEKVPTSDSAVV